MADGDANPWRSLASPALLRGLAVTGLVMLVVGVAAQMLVALADLPGYARAFAGQLSRLFYAGAEYTAWAWYTAVLIAAVGVTLAVLAALHHRAGAPAQPYAVLAAVALLLSVDETAQLHESLSTWTRALGVERLPTVDWLLVGIPIAVFVGIMLLIVARRIDAQLRRGLIIGGAVFLFGAIVLEGVGGLVMRAGSGDPVVEFWYQVLLAVEEGVELAGVLIALAACLAAIEWRGVGANVEVRVREAAGSVAT